MSGSRLGVIAALAAMFVVCHGAVGASAAEFHAPPGSPYPATVDTAAGSTALGDLNGDGLDDAVVSTASGSVGSYVPHLRVSLAGPGGEMSRFPEGDVDATFGNSGLVELGDFDEDGDQDALLLINSGFGPSGALQLYPGNGDGTFGQHSQIPTSDVPTGLDVTDVNGDGHLDAVVLLDEEFWGDAPARVSVFLGDGAGGFSDAPGSPVPVFDPPDAEDVTVEDVVARDFDGDGIVDFAIAGYGYPSGSLSGMVILLISNPDGSYSRPPRTLTDDLVGSIGSGDLDGDGRADLVAAGLRLVGVMFGDGEGGFSAPASHPVESARMGPIADFDGDGLDDVAVSKEDDETGVMGLTVLEGDGGRALSWSEPAAGVGVPAGPAGEGDVNGDGEPDLVVTTGQGMYVLLSPAPGIGLEPDNLQFGSQPVGVESQQRTVVVSNTGAEDLNVTGFQRGGAHPDDFSVSPGTCGALVPPGSHCELGISFTPGALGQRSATIEVTSNAGPPRTVSVGGTGTANPGLSADPAGLDLGEVVVGADPATGTITLRSDGTTPVTVGTLAIAGPDGGEFGIARDECGGSTMAPGEACEVEVAFDPASAGPKQAVLSVPSDSGQPLELPLRGDGGANPGIEIEPGAHDFSTVTLGDPEESSATFTVTSAGTTPATVSAARIEGADASQFALRQDGCSGAALAPGEECELRVAFEPDAEGRKSAVLLVESDAPQRGEAQLSGTAERAPQPPPGGGPGVPPPPPPTPCEPVEIGGIRGYRPSVKRRPDRPGVRLRLHSRRPALAKVTVTVGFRSGGKARSLAPVSRTIRVRGGASNLKLPVPRKLRQVLAPGKKVRLTVRYRSRALAGGCREFGPERLARVPSKVVWISLPRR